MISAMGERVRHGLFTSGCLWSGGRTGRLARVTVLCAYARAFAGRGGGMVARMTFSLGVTWAAGCARGGRGRARSAILWRRMFDTVDIL